MSPPHLQTSYFITPSRTRTRASTRTRPYTRPYTRSRPSTPLLAQSCTANFSHIFAPLFFIRYPRLAGFERVYPYFSGVSSFTRAKDLKFGIRISLIFPKNITKYFMIFLDISV